ncbi:MAG TPA: dTDP-4-dehydrorhamnose 3,5-epimerase [Cytophagaceae bacterium]|nr:dTDP-4-dehydrorhamnose 3,5-epimerase [Cytophagaceae bacterium]
MEVRETFIKDLVEIYPKIFKDERGFFLETYNRSSFEKAGIKTAFVQDNQSFSIKGVLRGLHFQKPPFAQAKLVSVISGRVLDVAVDLRKDSPTFGKHFSVVLEAEKRNMLLVPEGFAHGFVALEDSVFSYKCSNVYNKESEGGIIWNDKDLSIDWGFANPLVSEKDLILPTFKDLKI